MKLKEYTYKVVVKMVDPNFESPIIELIGVLSEEANRLGDRVYRRKALAIHMKWLSLSFLRAEITALDKAHAGSQFLKTQDKSLIISKIETYLSTSRAILDILTYCLCKSFDSSGPAKTFNNLRKRSNLPGWLANFVSTSMLYCKDESMSKNGWLLNLVTDKKVHGTSLRDFVTHGGTIDLEGIQQFDGEYRFGFKPRAGDQFNYHIEDMVDKVHKGICELFRLITINVGQLAIEQGVESKR
jgi:hypothetical protein